MAPSTPVARIQSSTSSLPTSAPRVKPQAKPPSTTTANRIDSQVPQRPGGGRVESAATSCCGTTGDSPSAAAMPARCPAPITTSTSRWPPRAASSRRRAAK